jgi:uncharacterized protein YodC (DUF2158 family)
MSTDTPTFKCGDVVYHKAGGERGVVTGVMYRDCGFTYEVTWPNRIVEFHTACELSRKKVPVEKGWLNQADEDDED